MGSGADQLKAKALLALEEALQELRYRPIRRSMALRFAMAYLWASSGRDRAPFHEYWRALADERIWRFSGRSGADRDNAAVGVEKQTVMDWPLRIRFDSCPDEGDYLPAGDTMGVGCPASLSFPDAY
jgi:hypothetical protein